MNCFNHLKTNNVLYKVITFFSQNIELKSRSGLFRNLFLMAIFIFIVISKSAVSSNMLFSIPTEVSFSETEAKEHTEQQAFMQWLIQNPVIGEENTEALNYFLQSTSTSVSSAARSIMVAHNLLEYDEPYLNPDLTKSIEVKKINLKPNAFEAASLKVYPNPANEFVTIEYNTGADVSQAVIEVIDESGRRVYNNNLGRQFDQIILDTRNFKPGNYIVRLVSGSKYIGNSNVIISR